MDMKFYYVIYSFFIFYINTFCICQLNYCTDDYEVIGDLDPKDCPSGLYYEKSKETGCMPQCIPKAELNKNCLTKKCAPGLKCNIKCEIDEGSCHKFKYINAKRIWTPVCLKDGTYAPKQCKGTGENERCFCFDAKGERIFGEEWKKEAEDMTCACSRHRSDLKQAGRLDITLHCDSKGNYEPLQCDADLCWCAEPLTGAVLSSVVPQSMMEFLPCYNPSDIGEQYLRQCESQNYARAKILETTRLHGVTENVISNTVTCGWDGSYGRFKVDSQSNIMTCINRDGTTTGPWQAEIVSNTVYNCNCARDTILYKSAGIPFDLKCEGSGSYKKLQGSAGQYYCVDVDGYRTTEYEAQEIDPINCPEE